MTLYNFMMLDLKEQASELFEKGTFVTALKKKNRYYELYALSSIFVEVKRKKKNDRLLKWPFLNPAQSLRNIGTLV